MSTTSTPAAVGVGQPDWLAYAFEITTRRAMLSVGQRVSGAAEVEAKTWTASWELPSPGVVPDPPGVEAPLGLSGIAGSHLPAASSYADSPGAAAAHLRQVDTILERVLADLINDLIWMAASAKPSTEAHEPVPIVVQGPAFPKLIGRLAYRRVPERFPGRPVVFITFRRRFLLAHPNDSWQPEDGRPPVTGLAGPFPDRHHESLVYRFYYHPRVAGDGGWHLPLMIEVLTAPTARADWATGLAKTLLSRLGAREGSVLSGDWCPSPTADLAALRRVWVPQPLMRLHEACLTELNNLRSPGASDARVVEMEAMRALRAVANLQDFPDNVLLDAARRFAGEVRGQPSLSDGSELRQAARGDNLDDYERKLDVIRRGLRSRR